MAAASRPSHGPPELMGSPARHADIGWCRAGTDSIHGSLWNNGGWAYRLVVSLETASGLVEVRPTADRVGPVPDFEFFGALDGVGVARFTSASRDSAGVRLPLRVVMIRWQDYGGVPDSLVDLAWQPDPGGCQ